MSLEDRLKALRCLHESGLHIAGGVAHFPAAVKRIKIDIGLSTNAPQSAVWLGADHELGVIGVEPVRSNIEALESGTADWPVRLDPTLIGSRFFILPVALGNVRYVQAGECFVTADDPGCSSLLRPSTFALAYTQSVDIWPLSLLLSLLPWGDISYIEHLKIDAQGLDLEILRSAGDWITRILAITVEPEVQQYTNADNSERAIRVFMRERGFVDVHKFMQRYFPRKWRVEVADPTFVNPEVYFTQRPRTLFLYQQG